MEGENSSWTSWLKTDTFSLPLGMEDVGILPNTKNVEASKRLASKKKDEEYEFLDHSVSTASDGYQSDSFEISQADLQVLTT
jgi:hypothetical protein